MFRATNKTAYASYSIVLIYNIDTVQYAVVTRAARYSTLRWAGGVQYCIRAYPGVLQYYCTVLNPKR